MKKFKEYFNNKNDNEVEYIIVQLPEDLIDENALINEGIWVPSGRSGWMQRVDPENPAMKISRHVHVAKEKHISNKNMQAAWNIDGTRHDKSTFNDKVSSLKVAQTIAKQALGLDDKMVLEEISKAGQLLLEHSSNLLNSAPIVPLFLHLKSTI